MMSRFAPGKYSLGQRMILVILGCCLVFGMVPLADMDFDGAPESFLSETNLVIPAILGIVLSAIFVSLPFMAHPTSRPSFSFLLVPPPIQ